MFVALALLASVVAPTHAGDLDVAAPAGSITARTLTVQDASGATGEWSVRVDADDADRIVLGVPVAVGTKGDEVEIPALILMPATGDEDSVLTIKVSRGDLVVHIEYVALHRTKHRADITQDGRIDSEDLTALLASWGRCASGSSCPADLDSDGLVDGRDVSLLVAAWHL